MHPLFIPGVVALVALHPAVSAVEIAVAADALQGGVVVADYAPCLDLCIGVGEGGGEILVKGLGLGLGGRVGDGWQGEGER